MPIAARNGRSRPKTLPTPGHDPDGPWLADATRLDVDCVERRDEFVTEEDDETPAIEEITADHWAYRDAHREETRHSLRQNIAAISGDFHTHPLYGAFYEAFGRFTDGFVGNYDICVEMAEALTDWEFEQGGMQAYENAGTPWIEVVEAYVGQMLERSLQTEDRADPRLVLRELPALQECAE